MQQFFIFLFQIKTPKNCKKKMAPKVGLEPTTDRLTADCSTTELLRKDPNIYDTNLKYIYYYIHNWKIIKWFPSKIEFF